jgi:hypothetical protein
VLFARRDTYDLLNNIVMIPSDTYSTARCHSYRETQILIQNRRREDHCLSSVLKAEDLADLQGVQNHLQSMLRAN